MARSWPTMTFLISKSGGLEAAERSRVAGPAGSMGGAG